MIVLIEAVKALVREALAIVFATFRTKEKNHPKLRKSKKGGQSRKRN